MRLTSAIFKIRSKPPQPDSQAEVVLASFTSVEKPKLIKQFNRLIDFKSARYCTKKVYRG